MEVISGEKRFLIGEIFFTIDACLIPIRQNLVVTFTVTLSNNRIVSMFLCTEAINDFLSTLCCFVVVVGCHSNNTATVLFRGNVSRHTTLYIVKKRNTFVSISEKEEEEQCAAVTVRVCIEIFHFFMV